MPDYNAIYQRLTAPGSKTNLFYITFAVKHPDKRKQNMLDAA